MTTILNILLKRSCKLAGLAVLLAMPASSQSWFFNWDGTTDLTCVPTIEGNNAFFQGSALSNSVPVSAPAASPTYYWDIVDNGGGGKAFRQAVTSSTGFRWYGYGSRPEYYRGPCTTFAVENLRADRNAFTIAFRIKAENCTSSTGKVRFFNCEFETTVLNPFWPAGGAYEPYYAFRVEFSLKKDASNSDIWLVDRNDNQLCKLKTGSTANWHTIWATCELPPYPYTTTTCVYRLWADGTEVNWPDFDRGGWSDCEVGWTPTNDRYATFALDYLCYTYGAYQPGAIAIPTERAVAPTNSITALKVFPDGTPCELTNKAVTGIFTDLRLGMKYYYVSEPDGSDGIKIRHNTGRSPQNTGGAAVTLAVGDIVSIKGGLSSAECEKQVSAYEIVRASTGAPIAAPATVSTADLVESLNSALFASTPAQLLVVPETGVVSGLTGTNTMTDTDKNWAANQWKNMTVFLPATANHPDLYYYIIANTSNSLTTSHRTIRPDFNVAPDIVADGVRVGDGYEFVGGKPTGPRLDGRYLWTIGTVTAVNPTAGYFDINDGSALGEVRTLQDIWDRINYGNVWTNPAGLRVKWNGTMPSVGDRLSVKGCAGAERFKHQVSTTINGSPRDEVKVDKVYPLFAADSFVPFTDPPTAFAVTGGGAYCSGGSGVAVGLSGSETGVNYQLYRDGTTAVGSPVAGTGSALNFGNQTVAGTYTVKGTRTDCTAGCTLDMSGSAVVTVNPVAAVDAGPDQVVCYDSPTVTLAGAIGGAATSGTWSGGAGTFTPDNTTLNATYTPTAGEITAGSVTLTLATDDPAGPCGAVSDAMVITINPVATVNAGADQTVCASSPVVTLAGAVGGAAASGTWSGGAGTFTPDNTTLDATYTPTAGEITAGSVTLTLTTDDPAGPCGTVSDAMVITINPVATVNAGADQTVCASSPVVALVGAVGGAAASGTWSGGAGTFLPDNTTLNATYTPTAGEITAGTVTLTLATDDPAGPCGAVNDAMVITINPVATVDAGADQTVCASSPVVALAGAVGGAAASGTWSGGAGTFLPDNTTLNATYTPTAGEITAGSVTLTLATDDPAGPCGAVNDAMVITINPALGQVTIGSIRGTTLTYSGGSGSKFILLKSANVKAPLSGWSRVDTNTVTPGSFTIPAVGTGSPVFYSVKSE